jgi:hypothetical protein
MADKHRIDMSDFISWMVREGRSPGTAKVYASNVRVLLKETGDRWLDQDFLDGLFEKIREENPTLYPARLSGFNAWVDFHAANGKVIARPTKKGKADTVAPLPDAVCDAIRTLRSSCAMSFRIITLTTWEEVEFADGARGNFYHVRDPSKEGVVFKADADAIDTLLDWADPANLFVPLVPQKPGSDQPYPLKALKREIAKGQETVKERVARLREERRKKNGSALGAAGADDNETVTAANYTSDYLPKVNEDDSVEGLLGLGSRPAVKTGPPVLQDTAGKLDKQWFDSQKAPFSNDLPRPEGAESGGPATGNGLRKEAEAEDEAEETNSKPKPKASRTLGDYMAGYEDGKYGRDQRSVARSREYRAGWADGTWEAESGEPSFDPPDITEETLPPEPNGIKERPPVTGSDGEIYDPNDPDYADVEGEEN